ncbi:serine hydrolase [Streptomyces sp. ME01-18a]|uniref:serine hydrolase domain-containing protein n=1 Tax=Streptomyces sp. ME01-18a TaxID=3028669 RepID=UPI0029B5E4D7|nr:serine hydrolase domain-containing protein [Streptomyces sp. ME01-18a]MDX3434403.1 serine hydrolase [Streptomyces sp. ME01-18a]
MKSPAVLPLADPTAMGFSPSRLASLDAMLTREVTSGQMPGAVVGIARGGHLIHLKAFGYRDPDTRAPMATDSLFWIASMTKPITTVGTLALHEQGRLLLDDPLPSFLPEFADQEVAELNPASGLVRQVPALRPPTIQDLLRHTSGIVEGLLGDTPVHKMYADAVSDGMTDYTGQQFIERLSRVPLLHQPGTLWHYGWGLDLVGLIIEKITRGSLRKHLHDSVFAPLGMHDTTFGVPEDQRHRFAHPYSHDPMTGRPQGLPDLSQAEFDSGGAGLVSTAVDYLRFAQMLLDHGRLGSTQVLGRKTVEYMTSDQLDAGTSRENLADMTARLEGYTFGLGLAIRRQNGLAPTAGSVGDMTWPGAAGTYWWVDPREDLAVVFLTHTPSRAARVRYYQLIRAAVLQAFVD